MIDKLIQSELKRQSEGIVLIASENYCSSQIREAVGSILCNKYSEGYPGARYYSGNEFIDTIEAECINTAKEVFNMPHANVQPHSGSQANQAVFLAALNPGDSILSLNLEAGGHLSHGAPISQTGKLYKITNYTVDPITGLIDYEKIAEIAKEIKPNMIICGASAYSREIDFSRFSEIAKSVDALLLADIAHIAGLVASDLHPSPAGLADFITMTTHKTLAGPRGGLILCTEDWAQKIDRAVFPGLQGGPFENIIAGKAICLKNCQTPEFKETQRRTIESAKAMAEAFLENDFKIVSGGTDNHLFTLDLSEDEVSAIDAVSKLEAQGIYTNANMIPFDPGSARNPSGVRIGTPAICSRGMGPDQARKIAYIIIDIIISNKDRTKDIVEITSKFPIK